MKKSDLTLTIEEIREAIAQDPDNPIYYLQLANMLKAKGRVDEAKQLLVQMTKQHPTCAPAFNNLGNIYFAEERWTDAITNYQAAIDIQSDYLDAYYNLGLAYLKLKRNKDAILLYQSLLLLAPKHLGAQFQLACIYMQEERYDEATPHFLLIIKEHPFHVEAEVNLASCYLKLGQVDQAKIHYRQALVLIPHDKQVLFNLGVISTQQGRIYDAIEYYLRLEEEDPFFFPVQQNLGAAFLTIKKRDQALLHFKSAQAIDPGNAGIAHLVHVLSQDKPLTASPPEYIKTLFDAYADHYDAHLTSALQYEVPIRFYEAVKNACGNASSLNNHFDILDLGCGTGLCGELFKPWAKKLSGVDISKKMLDMAAQKRIYDELVEDDIVSYIEARVKAHATYDLVLAGDVLVYFGDLSSLLKAVSTVLRDKGLFVFNTEISNKKDYQLQKSGRFAHSLKYISELAKQCGLIVFSHEVCALREDQQEKVEGFLFVLEKMHEC